MAFISREEPHIPVEHESVLNWKIKLMGQSDPHSQTAARRVSPSDNMKFPKKAKRGGYLRFAQTSDLSPWLEITSLFTRTLGSSTCSSSTQVGAVSIAGFATRLGRVI